MSVSQPRGFFSLRHVTGRGVHWVVVEFSTHVWVVVVVVVVKQSCSTKYNKIN
jgi:hypothetical protein